MRLRNIKNKDEILLNSKYLLKNCEEFCGRWKDVFKNDNPIYIEIGMGKGKFIIDNALNYKDVNFIGIEKMDNVLARAIPKIPDELDNLKIISMNALNIDKVFNNEIDRVYLNFSDPWPKDRHSDRRLTSKIFLEKYDKIFKNTKDIYLRTDNSNLFRYSLETLSQYGYSFLEVSFDLHGEQDFLITTEYEDKFVQNGDKIYALHAVK